MDNALCGGGDPGAGITSTAVPISASAVNMIKAAIFMGDPRWQYGLAYEVGTCRAGGVSPSVHVFRMMETIVANPYFSSLLALLDSSAPTRARSNPTATPRTPTAALVTVKLPTRAMSASMASRLSPSSTASLALATAGATPEEETLEGATMVAAATARQNGANAVAKGGLEQLAANREVLVKRKTNGTLSACKDSAMKQVYLALEIQPALRTETRRQRMSTVHCSRY
jgi:hypothetical protein